MAINKMNSPLFNTGKEKWGKFVESYSGPYDFSNSVYAGMNRKVSYVCPKHGEIASDAKNMMAGAKCPKCAFEARKGRNRLTGKKMLERFRQTHGDRYDYSAAVYAGQQIPVAIKCPDHGTFFQKPEFHWSGSRCPNCFHDQRRGASQRDTYESFVAKVIGQFGSLIEVPLFDYKNSQQDITVVCTKHGTTNASRPNWLVNGQNPCTKCNHMKSSGEDEIADFLSNFTNVVRRTRSVIPPRELDIYLPDHNLAIEYCGEFWHSHGDKESEARDKRKHIEKHEACAANGIRLITLWESEWKDHNYAIKRLLRNAIGNSKGKIMARKCTVTQVSNQEAKLFYDKYHPQGGAGSGHHYGLLWKGRMVACMRFVYGANDRGAAKRTWTLGRYATRITVVGAASRLFQAFINDHKPSEVKSFSDNRMFSGAMYEKLGFALEKDVDIDYTVWSPKLGLRPKSHYQRRTIQRRLEDHGIDDIFDHETDTRTEIEMTYLMGARRLYDCGKKRWLWKP
jgi:hypothetical protein